MLHSQLLKWMLVAVALRTWMAWNQFGWNHPDEWFQTVEFASFWSFGSMSGSQEVFWHLRNQTWPWILQWVLRLSDDPQIKLWLIQSIAGLSIIPWCLWASGFAKRQRWTHEKTNLVLGALCVAWFFPRESIRPSGETLSSAMLGLSLWSWEAGQSRTSGFFSIAMVAVRYPSLTWLIGFAAALPFLARQRMARWLQGAAVGVALFGLADWAMYGRPWESLYMYTVYNLTSGLGADRFGAQSVAEYLKLGNWTWWIYFAFALPFFKIAFAERKQPWVWGLVVYAIAHLWVAHKEPRFWMPILPLTVLGLIWISRKWAIALGIASLAFVVYTAAGFPQRPQMLIFKHPPRADQVCAVFLDSPLPSTLWPALPMAHVSDDRSFVWIEQAATKCEHRSVWIATKAGQPPHSSCELQQTFGRFASWHCAWTLFHLKSTVPIAALSHAIPRWDQLPPFFSTKDYLKSIEGKHAQGLW